MEKVFLTLTFVTVCSAFFFPFFDLQNGRQTMMNICIYSVDPSQYMPKCFMCPSTAYTNVLQTCVQAATIPSNVSYTQARCLEQNCAIRRGRRSLEGDAASGGDSSAASSELPNGTLLQLHQLEKRSDYDERFHGLSIVGEEESIAVAEEELELEYDEFEELL